MCAGRLSATMDHMLAQLTTRKDIPSARRVAPLTIRLASAADAAAVATLAELDSARAPRGDVLLAEVGDELWAALSLEDGHAVADPLRPSAEAVLVLAERSRQFKRIRRPRSHRLGRLRPARA
jgi:hypothetical protein